MIKGKNIVCISNTTWYGEYQRSSVQLLSRLGKYNTILYVEYAFTIKDVITGLLKKNKTPVKQILGIKDRLDVIAQHEEGKVVKMTLPPVIPFNHFKNDKVFRMVLKFNSFIIRLSVKKAMRRLKMKDVISITSFMPFYGLFLKRKLNEMLNVYYCYDSIDGKRNGPRGKTYETEYMKDIDGVIVTSDNLASQKQNLNPHIFTVKNGVDFHQFRKAVNGHKKPDHPKVVCYTGSIDQRFETEMVEHAIKGAPDYEFIFVGPVRNKAAAEAISKYPNVKLKPPVPPEEIPLILYNSHVGIIPYTRTHLNKNVYPLKINEYLAVGTPVVMTDFAHLPEFENLVSIAPDNETFFEKIKFEVGTDTPEKQAIRVETASKNSWESRTEAFADALQAMLDMKNAK
ncbi:MAG: glycosyltransferase [Bacteroidetes bacterium]|nr:glycosyltransferase [Bacteroidota bacterium]